MLVHCSCFVGFEKNLIGGALVPSLCLPVAFSVVFGFRKKTGRVSSQKKGEGTLNALNALSYHKVGFQHVLFKVLDCPASQQLDVELSNRKKNDM